MSEPLMRRLSELPTAELGLSRATHIRMRCHAQLARQARPRKHGLASALPAPTPQRRTAQVWQPLMAVLGVAYLTVVIVFALGLYGVP